MMSGSEWPANRTDIRDITGKRGPSYCHERQIVSSVLGAPEVREAGTDFIGDHLGISRARGAATGGEVAMRPRDLGDDLSEATGSI